MPPRIERSAVEPPIAGADRVGRQEVAEQDAERSERDKPNEDQGRHAHPLAGREGDAERCPCEIKRQQRDHRHRVTG